MKEKEQTFLEKSKNALNEMSKENAIYDEIQMGPQEEPIIHDFPVDIQKYRRYIRKQSQMHNKRES